MRITRATWLTSLIVACALLLAALLKSGVETPPRRTTTGARVAVRIQALTRRALEGQWRAGGFVRAQVDITVSSERAGRVVALPIPEGGTVVQGQVVARLEDTVAAADLDQARAAAREAALDPDRPAAELARARANLRRAEYELRLHHPAAPASGRVEVHHVDVGEYVAAGTPLVDVLDDATLILDLDVDAEIVALIRTSGVTVEGRPARIRRVAHRADSRTHRFRVELQLKRGPLRPGMHAEARFELPAGPPAFYVPKAATRRLIGEMGVYVVRDHAARWVPLNVREVHYAPSLWRVIGGALKDGDELIVAGFSALRDGTPVEVER